MSTKSRRAGAALRRCAASFRASIRPIARASRETVEGTRRAPRRKEDLPQWKIETLEPRLLLSADAMPGVARIEGAIDQPGEQDAYEFVVSEKTRLFFDGVDGNQVQWQLRQAGTTLFNSRDVTATGDRFLELQPGTYSLSVDGINDTLGSYTFRLIGDQAATALEVNQSTSGTLQPGTQATLYSFSAQAGDRLYFQSDASTSSPRWTMFGPAANIVTGTNSWSDGGAYVADRTGTYWLSIEGPSGVTSAVDYAFALYRSTPSRTVLQPGETQHIDLTVPGSAAYYDFTLTDTAQVAWDQLSASLSDVRWALTNAAGTQLGTGRLDAQDGSTAPMLLPAGSYSLRIEGESRGTGAASFRLLTSTGAASIGAQASLAAPSSDSRAGQVVRIDATAAASINVGLRTEGTAGGTSIAEAIDLLTDGGNSALASVTLGGTAAGEMDVRLYRIACLGGEPLLISTSGAGFEARVRLFDANGNEVAATTGDTLRATTASAGLYYVGVGRAANATYDPQTTFSGSAEPAAAASLTLSVTRLRVSDAGVQLLNGDVPDTMSTARSLLLPRGSSLTVPITIGDGPQGNRDVDMFRLTLQAGEVLRTTTPNGTFDGYARVFNASGQQVAVVDDSPLNWTVTASGIYYLGISGYPNRTYSPTTGTGGSTGATGTLSLTITRDIGTASGTAASASWRLTDPTGNTLSSGNLGDGQAATAALPQAGTYYLWTQRDLGAVAGSTFEIERWSDPAPSSATLSSEGLTTFADEGLSPRQTKTFDVNVATSGTWLFAAEGADNGQWQLVGPRGVVSEWRTFSESRGASASPVYLSAGSHQLRVRLTSQPFSLFAAPLASAAVLDAGTPASLAGLAVGASALWHTASERGDAFDFAAGATDEFAIAAFDAYGRELYRGTSATGTFQQGWATGDVYLRVTRQQVLSTDPVLTVHRTSANLTDPTGIPITLGTPVTTAAPVDTGDGYATQRYEFDLATDGPIVMEWEGAADQVWRLTGPRGIETEGPLGTTLANGGRWSLPVQWLPAGHYALDLVALQSEARFTVRAASGASSIAPGTHIAVDLAADDGYELFDITLHAGSDQWFRADSGAGTGNVFRLYDSGGALVAEGDPAQSVAVPFNVPRDGHYLLAIARNTGVTPGGSALRFAVYEAPRVGALTAGTTEGQFLLGSQTYSYGFTVTSGIELAVRETVNGGTRNTYEVLDAAGRTVAKLNYNDSYTDTIWALGPGSYTLRVRYASSTTPTNPVAYAFNTRFIQRDAQTWEPNTSASVTWSNGAPDRELRFSLAAGESRWIAPSPALGYYDRIDYRVIDPLGAEVARGFISGGYWSTPAGFAVAAATAGDYTVQLVGTSMQQGKSMSGTTTLQLSAGTRSAQALVLGTPLEGSLATPADEAVYRFTLVDPARVWMNVSGDAYTATLVRTDVPTGIFSRGIDSSDQMGVLDLLAGSYELRLVANRSSAGSYRVDALPVGALPALTLGQSASQTVAQSRQAMAWQLQGTAGQDLLIDLRNTDTYTSQSWVLVAPNGSNVASGSQYYQTDSAQKVKLTSDGTYVLYAYGHYNSTGARTATVTVSPVATSVAPIALGDQVSGAIGAPGNVNQYRFTLIDETTVLLDPQGGTVSLTLSGPLGDELSFGLSSVESYYARRLKAGTYTIAVSASGVATPSYAFRLLDLAAAVPASSTTPLSGDLPAGRTLVAYRFEATPGVDFNLDFTTPVSYPDYFRYTLLDAYGRTLSNVAWTSDASVAFTGPSDGTVYLVAKQYYASSAPIHFEATLRQPVVTTAALAWDSATAVPLAVRQDQATYAFTLDEPGWIELQNVNAPASAVRFQIITPNGSQVVSRTGLNSGSNATISQFLGAGSYALRVLANADGLSGNATFTATRVPASQRLDRQGAVARAVLADAGAGVVSLWSLDARAGDHLTLAANATWPADWTAQLMAPNGTVLRSWTPASAPTQEFDLTQPGTHLLRLTRTGIDATADLGAGAVLTATWGTAETPASVVSTFSAAGAIANGATQTYQFELAEPGLWYLDHASIPNVYSYSYQSATVSDVNGAVRIAGYDQAAWLTPGVYAVKITQSSSASAYDFALRRLDSAEQVPVIAYGQSVTAASASTYAARAWRVDAQAGDLLQFNAHSTSGSTPRYAFFNAYGQPLTSWASANSDSAVLPVLDSGPVYVVFDWANYTYGGTPTGGMSFQIDNLAGRTALAMSLNETVSGTLNAARQSREYSLVLSEDTAIQFDRLNSGVGSVSWAIVDVTTGTTAASGTMADGMNTPSQPSFMLLPGRYTVRVSTSSTADTSYALRLIDLTHAMPIASGAIVEGRLEPSGDITAYSVQANAGDRIYVDLRDLAARVYAYDAARGFYHYNYTGAVRVIDPYGRSVSDVQLGDTELVAAVTGRYTIVLDDSLVYDTAVPYRMAVYVYGPSEPRTIDLSGTPPSMDLVVSDVSVSPAQEGDTIASGASIRVQWTVRNQGSVTTLGDFTDRIIVRRAGSNEVVAQMLVPYIESAPDQGPLLPEQMVIRAAVLRLPDGPSGAGELNIIVETDAANDQPEGGVAEENNRGTASFASTLASYANLQVSDLRMEPASNWSGGDTVTVRWNTANAGTAVAAGSWTERVELLNLTTGVVVVSQPLVMAAQQIVPGEAAERGVAFAWPQGLNAIGNFRLRVMVDALAQVPEYDTSGALEADNTAQQNFVAGPDLVVRNVALLQTAPQAGDTVTLQWEDVNQGSEPTPVAYQDRVVVRQRNADGTAGAVVVNAAVAYTGDAALPLAPGQSRARSFTFTLPDGLRGTGTFDIAVTVDSNASGAGLLFETSLAGNAEANNSAAASFTSTARPYADLSVTDLVVPTTVESGGEATLTWTVANAGNAAATGSWTDRIILTRDTVTGNADDVILLNVKHATALEPGSSYTQSATVRIPTRLEGAYRIAVVSDANATVREPDTRADNLRLSGVIDITQTYADLVPSLVSVPAEVYAARSARVEWSVLNTGTVATDVSRWVDQVYLSATPELTSSATLLGSVTHVGVLETDASYSAALDVQIPRSASGAMYFIVKSDAFGAVYELGRTANNVVAHVSASEVRPEPRANFVVEGVTAPTDWRVGQTVQVGYTVRNAGNDAASTWLAESVRLVDVNDATRIVNLATPSASRTLAPGAGYSHSLNITVPAVPAGQWRLEVQADAWGYVSESSETDNVGSTTVAVVHPDLVVRELATTGALQGGETVTLRWTTANQGTATAASVRDAVYLSQDGVVGSGDLKLGEVTHASLAAGASTASELVFQLPIDLDGAWRLIVVTDAGGQVNENTAGETNNTDLLDILVARDYYADLSVVNVQAPTLVIDDPATVTVEWTVSNLGTGPGRTLSWTDRIIYSQNDVIGDHDDVVLGNVVHEGGLQAGESYTGSITYRFGPGYSRHGKVFVRTDAASAVWEHGQEANNQAVAPEAMDIMPIPYADLQVESLSTPTEAYSGRPITIHWTVANLGLGITNTGEWVDGVWLSSNADGSGKRWELGSSRHLGQLASGDRYSSTIQAVLPEGISGTYYLHVSTSGPFEFIHTTNNTRALGVPVQLSPSPDLLVESVTAPGSAREGTLIDLSWTVMNQGAARAAVPWVDTVLLVPASGAGAAVVLGTYTYDRGLDAGIRYTRTEQIRLPAKIEGAYRLRVVTNSGQHLYEHGAARDNNTTTAGDVTEVSLNPRPDLRVSAVVVPDSVAAGTRAAVRFTVTNMGSEATSGQWADHVYLSLDGTVSGDDVLVARPSSGAALAPGESYTTEVAAVDIPIRYRGDAYLIVEADGKGRVDEYPNEPNNTRAQRFHVDAVPFADLVASDVVAPEQAVHGSTVEVRYRVTNRGAATTLGDSASINSWTDTVWLSVDPRRPSPAKGDVRIGQVTHNGHLAVGDNYLGTLNVQIPEGVRSGQYYITVWSDTYDAILEDTMAVHINPDDPGQIDNNNYKARPISVLGVAPPDLVVSQVQAMPAMTAAGDYAFSYTVQNRGDLFEGRWTDRVWIADNADLKKATVTWLLGEYAQQRSLNNGESYTVTQTVPLAPAVQGGWLVVETDREIPGVASRFEVAEYDETNNVRAEASAVGNRPADLRVTAVQAEPEKRPSPGR